MMAVANDGRSVLLSKDWASTSGDEIKAEWEPVVKALISSNMSDIGSLDSVTVDSTTAIGQIIDSSLVDTTDGRGDLRARALIEYLIESGVFDITDDDLVLLESFDSKMGEDDTSLLVAAAIFEHVSDQISDMIDKVEESKEKDFETVESDVYSQVIEDHIPIEPQELTEKTALNVEYLSDINDSFEYIEEAARRQVIVSDLNIPNFETLLNSVGELDKEEILAEALHEDVSGELSEDEFEEEMSEIVEESDPKFSSDETDEST
jgi:hypothetical protein